MNTIEILDMIKARYGLPSDYALAKKLNISRARVSTYRTRGSSMDDELCLVCENLLELPEGSLLFELQASRTKCKKAAELFHKISQQLTATAASILLAVSMTYSSFSGEALASPAPLLSLAQCILC